ncbi:MAG: tetratricopeptide repeat protein [Nitrospinales bacterium]
MKYDSLNLKRDTHASLKEAIRLDPLEPNYHLTLGAAYFSAGDLKNAEKEFLQTLRLDENYSEAHRTLGRLYMQQQKWQEAIDHFKKSFKGPGVSSPHQVYNWLALSYYAQGNFDQAEKEWITALRIKENPSIRLNLALAYRDQGRFDLAIDSLRKALSLDPKLITAHHQIALLLLKKKDLAGARKHFQEVIQRQPQSELAKNSKEYMEMIRPGN